MGIQEVSPVLANNISLVTAIGGVIVIIFAGWVNVIAARAAAQKAIAPVAESVAKIEAHVNSEKTRDQGVILAKDIQIKLQQEMIDELKRVSALLAQAQATRDLSQAVAQAAIAGATSPPLVVASAPVLATPVTPVLENIEKNTKEIAKNTK